MSTKESLLPQSHSVEETNFESEDELSEEIDEDNDFLFEALKPLGSHQNDIHKSVNASKTLTLKKNGYLHKSQVVGNEEIPADVMTNKASEVGPFWSVDAPLKSDSLKLLRELTKFYTPEKLERLIVPRAIKSLGIQKKYELSETVKQEINGISLRAIEWLVTNYSKGTKIVLYNDIHKKRVDIHNAYEIQSNHYKRNLFDPFCRHGRVYFAWDLNPLPPVVTETSTDHTHESELVKKDPSGPTNPKESPEPNDPKISSPKLDKISTPTSVVLVTTVGQLNFMKWADEYGILTYACNHQQEIQTTMESTLSKVNKEKKKFKKMGQRRKRKELTKAPDIFCTVYSVDTILNLDSFSSPQSSPKRRLNHP